MSYFLIHPPLIPLVGARLPISFRGFVAGFLGKAEYLGGLLQHLHHPRILLGARRRVLVGLLSGYCLLQILDQFLACWTPCWIGIRVRAWMNGPCQHPVQNLLFAHPYHVVSQCDWILVRVRCCDSAHLLV
jgi:hypothetical protein